MRRDVSSYNPELSFIKIRFKTFKPSSIKTVSKARQIKVSLSKGFKTTTLVLQLQVKHLCLRVTVIHLSSNQS